MRGLLLSLGSQSLLHRVTFQWPYINAEHSRSDRADLNRPSTLLSASARRRQDRDSAFTFKLSLLRLVFNQQASYFHTCAFTACWPNPRRCVLEGLNPVSGGYICRWCFSCCLFCGTVGGRCGTLPCFSFGPLSGAPDRWHDITGQACSTMQRSCGPLI